MVSVAAAMMYHECGGSFESEQSSSIKRGVRIGVGMLGDILEE